MSFEKCAASRTKISERLMQAFYSVRICRQPALRSWTGLAK